MDQRVCSSEDEDERAVSAAPVLERGFLVYGHLGRNHVAQYDVMCVVYVFFFFSSRRRHTRFDCDWSSDVCSSDLTMTTLEYNYRPPGTAMFSLGIQRQLTQSVVASVQYVGSRGWDQSDDRQINTLPLTDIADRQGVAGKIPDPNNPGKFLPAKNANLYRQFPGFSSIVQEENAT